MYLALVALLVATGLAAGCTSTTTVNNPPDIVVNNPPDIVVNNPPPVTVVVNKS